MVFTASGVIRPIYCSNYNRVTIGNTDLWALMKAELYRLHPELEHTPDIDTTLDVLILSAQEA
jgi:hypothetical protein